MSMMKWRALPVRFHDTYPMMREVVWVSKEDMQDLRQSLGDCQKVMSHLERLSAIPATLPKVFQVIPGLPLQPMHALQRVAPFPETPMQGFQGFSGLLVEPLQGLRGISGARLSGR